MKAIVIGGGPVGCMAAIRLRERSWDVVVYEKATDPRTALGSQGRSINMTLSRRGLRTLPGSCQEILYRHGVPCSHRVVHHADGRMVEQPYGLSSAEHLLSISRSLLNRLLVEEAANAGVRLHFGHECVGGAPERAMASFSHAAGHVQDDADLLIGADGTNSVVRFEMSRRGAKLNLLQQYIPYSYVELRIPARAQGLGHWIDPSPYGQREAQSLAGLHVWPRGDFMLLALPNADFSYTASLFLPSETTDKNRVAMDSLGNESALRLLFERHFSDAAERMPRLWEEFSSAEPGALRTLKCEPYTFGRSVLLGDAAHTMVPFFGQGVNCGFEDVHELVAVFDRQPGLVRADLSNTLFQYARTRTSRAHAITDLSLGQFQELLDHSGQSDYQRRHELERELYRQSPDAFTPLLNLVSFSELPYDEVADLHRRQRARLNDICARMEATADLERIVRSYLTESHASNESGLPLD